MSSGRLFDIIAGFLRFDEVANIRPCNLTFSEGHLIPRSKTDQMRQGNEVIIAKTRVLESYMQRGRVQLRSDLKLFRPISGGRCEKLEAYLTVI